MYLSRWLYFPNVIPETNLEELFFFLILNLFYKFRIYLSSRFLYLELKRSWKYISSWKIELMIIEFEYKITLEEKSKSVN